ncbi:MAG: hypothetical protein Kow0031_09480 [Anaerolineae bacterium]
MSTGTNPTPADTGNNRALRLEQLRADIWKLALVADDSQTLFQTLLPRVGLALASDNVTFLSLDENGKKYQVTQQWRADGRQVGADETIPAWAFKPYLGREVIRLSFDALPAALELILRPFVRKYHTNSSLIIPCGNPARPDSYLVVNDYINTRQYADDEIEVLLELSRVLHLRGQQLRKHAALQVSERRYQQIFETNQAIKLIIDPESGRIVDANPAALKFYGYDAATLAQMPIWRLNTLPETEVRRAMALARSGEQPFFSFQHRLASGEIRQVEVYSGPVETPGGQLLYSIIHDVTDRHQAEATVSNLTTMLNESQRIAKTGSYETDLLTGTWVGSDSFIEIFGLPHKKKYTVEEFQAIVHPDDFDEVMAYFGHCLANQMNFDYEYRCLRSDGKVIYVSSRSKVYYGPDGTPLKIIGIKQDITERKLAEEALWSSETRLTLALEGAGLATWDWNVQTDRAVISPRYLAMLGYEPDEIEPSMDEWRKVTHPEDLPAVLSRLQAHLNGETANYRAEYRMRHKSGGWKWFLDTGKTQEWDADGQPLRVMGILYDITDRKQAEEALRDSEARLTALISNIDTTIWSVDKEYRLIVGNPVFHRNIKSGLGRRFARGESVLSKAVPPEMADQWQGYYDRGLRGERFLVETRRRFVDPSRFMEYRFGPIVNPEGEVVGVTVSGRDITEQKNAEAELRKRMQYEHLLSQISALAITVDDLDAFQSECLQLMAQVLDVSRIYIVEYRAATKIYSNTFEWVAPGIAPQKENLQNVPADAMQWFQGMMTANRIINFANIADIPGPAEREMLAAQDIRSILAVPLFVSGEYYGFIGFDECRNHREWPEVDAQILASASRIVTGVIEHERLARQLVQQERLAAVGQLAAGIAHDFNNILAVMLGFTEILRASPAIPATAHSNLEQIIAAGERAAHLVRQILDFSQKTIRHPRHIELGAFMKEATRFLQHTLPENIRLTLQLPPTEYIIEADPTQLNQLITNLAINARDAMQPQGGNLHLSLLPPAETVAGDCAICQQRIDGQLVRIVVTDSGHGIPPEVLPRVFEPFFTTKTVGQGVGLGLSQVAGVVAQHNGHITINSPLNEGTSITVYLPLLSEPAPETIPAATGPNHAGQGETILLVEDDPTVQDVTRAMLEYLGYRVIIAENGRQALDLFDRHRSHIQLVLSDVVMPDLGGKELFLELRARQPAIKVVLMSGYPLAEQNPELIELGAAWFQKPVSISRLSRIIDDSLHGTVGRWD